jgi:hypothetical protein
LWFITSAPDWANYSPTYWADVFFGQCLGCFITWYYLCIYFDKNEHFGRLFRKLILSPCHHPTP